MPEARKPPSPVQGLTFYTLSSMFYASRVLTTQTFEVDTLSTYVELQRRLTRIIKDKDKLMELFHVLNELHEHTQSLGMTTLIRPQDHPLFMKQVIPMEK